MKSISEFKSLFRGLNLGYIEKVDGIVYNRKTPPEEELFRSHIIGEQQIGIYPVMENNNCFWGCIDFDHQAEDKPKKVFAKSVEFGVTPIPELSSSGEGYHLWYCFKDQINAALARKFLQFILSSSHLAEGKVDKIEIFPKTDKFIVGKWGSAVFLPLFGNLVKAGKTAILEWKHNKHQINIMNLPSHKIDTKVIKELFAGKGYSFKDVDIEDMLKKAGFDLSLRKIGNELWASCPFHDETRASFSINTDFGIWNCFGCGKKGNIKTLFEDLSELDGDAKTFEEMFPDLDISKIIERNGKTYIDQGEDKGIREVADFIITINRLVEDIGVDGNIEILRQINFSNGNLSKINSAITGLATPKQIGSAQQFKEFCLGKGNNFHWEGSQRDLDIVIKVKDSKIRDTNIYKQQHFMGQIDDIFIGAELYIHNNVVEKIPDDRIIKTPNKSLILSALDGSKEYAPFSKFPTDELYTRNEIVDDYRKIYKGLDPSIDIALGWCVASVWAKEIRNEFGFFPQLYLIGASSSGKTSLAELLLGFWGIQKIISTKGNSSVGIQRLIQMCQFTPVCADDYRYDPKDPLLATFRAIYDNSGNVKGTNKNTYEVISYTQNASLMITSEEAPEDNANKNRCVIIQTNGIKRNLFGYKKLRQRKYETGIVILEELTSKTPEKLTELFASIEKWTDILLTQTGDERRAQNLAICAATYELVFGSNCGISEYDTNLSGTINSLKNEIEIGREEESLEIFWGMFEDLATTGNIIQAKHYWITKEGTIQLRLRLIHDEYSERCKAIGRIPVSYSKLRNELGNKPYFIAYKQVSLPSNTKEQQRVVIIDKDIFSKYHSWINRILGDY